jgi:hypothetical protein
VTSCPFLITHSFQNAHSCVKSVVMNREWLVLLETKHGELTTSKYNYILVHDCFNSELGSVLSFPTPKAKQHILVHSEKWSGTAHRYLCPSVLKVRVSVPYLLVLSRALRFFLFKGR